MNTEQIEKIKNAGILAAQIVAAKNNVIREKIIKDKEEIKAQMLVKSKNLKI